MHENLKVHTSLQTFGCSVFILFIRLGYYSLLILLLHIIRGCTVVELFLAYETLRVIKRNTVFFKRMGAINILVPLPKNGVHSYSSQTVIIDQLLERSESRESALSASLARSTNATKSSQLQPSVVNTSSCSRLVHSVCLRADLQTSLPSWEEGPDAEPTKREESTQPQSTDIICWDQIISRARACQSTDPGLTFCVW